MVRFISTQPWKIPLKKSDNVYKKFRNAEEQVILKGLNAARFNFSHGSFEDQEKFFVPFVEAREELQDSAKALEKQLELCKNAEKLSAVQQANCELAKEVQHDKNLSKAPFKF